MQLSTRQRKVLDRPTTVRDINIGQQLENDRHTSTTEHAAALITASGANTVSITTFDTTHGFRDDLCCCISTAKFDVGTESASQHTWPTAAIYLALATGLQTVLEIGALSTNRDTSAL